jgi:hypothetical protein
MKRRACICLGLGLCLTATVSSGCVSFQELIGLPKQSDPSVEIRSAEPKWLLIKNPRFGDVPSEPEYIWVEEDKMPTTMKTLVFGKSSLIAPPEIVAKYGSPPGGGRISPRQKVPIAVDGAANTSTAARPAPGAQRPGTPAGTAATPPEPAPARGFVVFVDSPRVVIDLTAKDGVRTGALVSFRRDRIPIVHPVTGELLGELDEELATGKVTEVRDKFSVVEVQSVAPGVALQVKDRVVVR